MRFLALLLLASVACHADATLPRSLFSIAGEPHPGYDNLTDLGLALTTGNTDTSSLRLKQQSSYRWERETVALQARYLKTTASGLTGARNWALAGRYERRLAHHLGGFTGQSVEGDRFAGVAQRYATDLGLRRTLWWGDVTRGAVEAGYRYQLENREVGPRRYAQIARVYAEASYKWNPKVGSLLSVEGLPNLRETENWFLNAELATQAELQGYLAMKVAYALRFSNRPATAGLKSVDGTLTASLVADF
jgi:putative salt-induced outer membrane protein YdiY